MAVRHVSAEKAHRTLWNAKGSAMTRHELCQVVHISGCHTYCYCSYISPILCRDQITERAAFMSRLVDGLLRGRSPPFARHEAAAAMSEVRAFVRAWRPTTTDRRVGAQESEGTEDGGCQIAPNRPSSDALLKLAQVRHAASGTAHAL